MTKMAKQPPIWKQCKMRVSMKIFFIVSRLTLFRVLSHYWVGWKFSGVHLKLSLRRCYLYIRKMETVRVFIIITENWCLTDGKWLLFPPRGSADLSLGKCTSGCWGGHPWADGSLPLKVRKGENWGLLVLSHLYAWWCILRNLCGRASPEQGTRKGHCPD